MPQHHFCYQPTFQILFLNCDFHPSLHPSTFCPFTLMRTREDTHGANYRTLLILRSHVAMVIQKKKKNPYHCYHPSQVISLIFLSFNRRVLTDFSTCAYSVHFFYFVSVFNSVALQIAFIRSLYTNDNTLIIPPHVSLFFFLTSVIKRVIV